MAENCIPPRKTPDHGMAETPHIAEGPWQTMAWPRRPAWPRDHGRPWHSIPPGAHLHRPHRVPLARHGAITDQAAGHGGSLRHAWPRSRPTRPRSRPTRSTSDRGEGDQRSRLITSRGECDHVSGHCRSRLITATRDSDRYAIRGLIKRGRCAINILNQ